MPRAKKQKTSKKIVNLLNPKTLRGGITLFALLFAIIGGGYLLYRSFAATTEQYIIDSIGDRREFRINQDYANCEVTTKTRSTPQSADIEKVQLTKGDVWTNFYFDTVASNNIEGYFTAYLYKNPDAIRRINGCTTGTSFYQIWASKNYCQVLWFDTTDANGDKHHNDQRWAFIGSNNTGACEVSKPGTWPRVRVRNSKINNWSSFYTHGDLWQSDGYIDMFPQSYFRTITRSSENIPTFDTSEYKLGTPPINNN